MKIYITHCETLRERRVQLEAEIKRLGLTDVEWITSYPKDHTLVHEWKSKTKSPIPDGYVSLSLKHYDACKRMCDDDIKEAIVFEDDVIFTSYFDISKIPTNYPYVKLGKGVPDMYIQPGDKPISIGNNGGTEAYYMRIEFARDFIQNLNMRWTIDIEQHGYLIHKNIPLICVPMCTQDFGGTSVHESKDYGMTWIEYLQRWNEFPKFTFKNFNPLRINEGHQA